MKNNNDNKNVKFDVVSKKMEIIVSECVYVCVCVRGGRMSFIFIGVYKNTRTRVACYRTITIFFFVEEAKRKAWRVKERKKGAYLSSANAR